ncbi:hypothetical protein X943_003911 [Babesia divergens]|uniref:Uncharacterized protein n=1 Tax=Babesia divergens TaxID=32595 RepID=A0AAD9LH68_BABDI|nr:hypothetical protein X943_003911 [Babesia divergens]
MDRYKECERFLKVAVAQQCKERGSLIKQDFAAVGKTTTGQISQISDASELIRQCFSMRGTADYQVLRKGCDILIDTLNFVDHGNETEGSDERQTIRKDRSLAGISKLLKECVFDESHICDDMNTSSAKKDADTHLFQKFGNGFYELDVLRKPDVLEPLHRPVAPEEAKEAINSYTCGSRGRYSGQGLSILPDDESSQQNDTTDVDMSDDFVAPKNLNIQQLFGIPGQTRSSIMEHPFEPYYECSDSAVTLANRDNDVTQYVGGLYPPLHTFYSSRPKYREHVSSIVSKNYLRRVFRERKPNLADHLLEKGKSRIANEDPLALVVRESQSNHGTKEMLLVNESLIRSKSSPDAAPVEYVAFIGEGIIRTFKCSTYSARIFPNRESRQSKMCSSLFASEVAQERLQSRMLLKLLRYEFAWRSMASHWRNHNDVISKAISNIEWGCMWQDWNFFTGGIVTELDMQNMIQRLQHFKEEEMDTTATVLRDVCDEFLNHLSTLRRSYESGELDVSTVVPELLQMYNTKVLGAFQNCYGDIRTGIYNDLKPLHSKMFPQLTAITSSKHAEGEGTSGTPSGAPLKLVDKEVLQMRLELLPKHNSDAIDMLSLTSIDDIIGPRLMDHPQFSGEPFLHLLTKPQEFNVNDRRLNITSTAMDLCKKCSEAYTKQAFTMDKRKAAKALSVLNALVVLLKNSERVFPNSKSLQEYLGTSLRVPSELTTWILSLFYERNGMNDYILNVKGYQKLTCYVMWLCIYLAAGKHTYNFATLRNVDLKTNRKIHAIFDKCVPIAGLVSKAAGRSNIYTLELPLGGISTPSSFKGLVGTIAGYGKRQRR